MFRRAASWGERDDGYGEEANINRVAVPCNACVCVVGGVCNVYIHLFFFSFVRSHFFSFSQI